MLSHERNILFTYMTLIIVILWKPVTALSEIFLLYRLVMNLYYMVSQLC